MATRRAPRKSKLVARMYEKSIVVDDAIARNDFLFGSDNGQPKRWRLKPGIPAPRCGIQPNHNNAIGFPQKNQRYENVSVTGTVSAQPITEFADPLSEVLDVKADLRSLLFTNPSQCWCCDTCDKEFPNYSFLAQHVGENTCNPFLREPDVPVPVRSTFRNSKSAIAAKLSGNLLYNFCSGLILNPSLAGLGMDE